MTPLSPNAAGHSIVQPMRMTRNTDIIGGFRDFWDYVRTDRPHRWPAMGLSIAIPLLIFYFIARAVAAEQPEVRRIIYFQNWTLDRSDYDVRRDWLHRAREANRLNQRRREAYGAFARALDQPFDKAAADKEFADAFAAIDQAEAELDRAQRLGLPVPPLKRRPPEPSSPVAGAPPAPPRR